MSPIHTAKEQKERGGNTLNKDSKTDLTARSLWWRDSGAIGEFAAISVESEWLASFGFVPSAAEAFGAFTGALFGFAERSEITDVSWSWC